MPLRIFLFDDNVWFTCTWPVLVIVKDFYDLSRKHGCTTLCAGGGIKSYFMITEDVVLVFSRCSFCVFSRDQDCAENVPRI